MNAFLTKIALRKTVGLFLGEHEVAVVKVASTPLGPVVIASSSEPCTVENLAKVIERLLVPLVGRKRRVSMAVGLAGSRLFFGTRLTPANSEAKPEAELQKALYSSNLPADDLVVDLIRGKVNKLPVAHMAACRRKYMAGVVAILSQLGVRPFRSEPSACALVRLAEHQYKSPRRSKTVVRVFLGAAQGLAVVVSGGLPLIWKPFTLPAFEEGFAILSTARGLAIQQTHYGIETPLDYVMIHGRADLHARLQKEGLPKEIGTRVIWCEEPALDGAAIAFGLALGCLSPDIKAFDLSRSLKARAPIKEIFPWKELGFAAGLIGCMAVVLSAHALKLHESYVALRGENSQHLCLASVEPEKLEQNKKAMEDKVGTVRNFLESRMAWTEYTRDISARLPLNAVLSGFNGKSPLDAKGKAASSFQLRGTAPLKNGSIPYDVDAFLGAIPNDPLWKRDFATIVTDIKLPLDSKKELAEVEFTINCGKGKK
jgi:hypothetical protein